jgi:hypothetical protein
VRMFIPVLVAGFVWSYGITVRCGWRDRRRGWPRVDRRKRRSWCSHTTVRPLLSSNDTSIPAKCSMTVLR